MLAQEGRVRIARVEPCDPGRPRPGSAGAVSGDGGRDIQGRAGAVKVQAGIVTGEITDVQVMEGIGFGVSVGSQ